MKPTRRPKQIVFTDDCVDINWDKQTKQKRLQKRPKTIEEIFAGVTFMVCVGLIILLSMVLIK